MGNWKSRLFPIPVFQVPPIPDTPRQFLQSDKVFMRKKKILMSVDNFMEYVVIDTLRGTRKLTLRPSEPRKLRTLLLVVDSYTLLRRHGYSPSLDLVDVETETLLCTRKPKGQKKTPEWMPPESHLAQMIVVGDWFYSYKNLEDQHQQYHRQWYKNQVSSLVRLKNFRSSQTLEKLQESEKVKGSPIVNLIAVNERIVTLSVREEMRLFSPLEHTVIVWEDMKIASIFELPKTQYGKGYSFIKNYDNERVILVSGHCTVLLLNIASGKMETFTHPDPLCLGPADLVVGGEIFVTTRHEDVTLPWGGGKQELRVFHLDRETMKVTDKIITTMPYISGVVAVEFNQVFVTGGGGYELWRVGTSGDDCLCRGKESGQFVICLLPLSRKENREESSRFMDELDNYVPVPKEVLGVIADFI